MPDPHPLPDPRVLSDEATYIATLARTLRLLADGLLGDHGYERGLPPTDPRWLNWEVHNVSGAGSYNGLDATLLAQVRDHPERLLLAGYVARAITARQDHYPLSSRYGSLGFTRDLADLPTLDLIAFVYALPARLRGSVVYGCQFLEAAMAQAPADLDAAMGMVAEFAHEPFGNTELEPWDDSPDTLSGIPYAALAQVCTALCQAEGPEAVASFLATLNNDEEEDA
jgi:hypothetical protein